MNPSRKMGSAALSMVAIAAVTVGTADAANAFVSFEDAPQLGLSDNQTINDQYFNSGFSFGLDNDLDGIADDGIAPALEQIGKGGTDGFVNATEGNNDVATAGYFNEEEGITYADRLGNYFLRTGGLGGDGGNLLISYTEGTSAASGELWDIDGNQVDQWGGNYIRTEHWEVQALGENNTVLESIFSPVGDDVRGELDGKPWQWSFERDSADIKAIRFLFIGESPAKNVGLAFDNFSAYSVEGQEVPEPASAISLLVLGMLGGTSMFTKRLRG